MPLYAYTTPTLINEALSLVTYNYNYVPLFWTILKVKVMAYIALAYTYLVAVSF